MPVTSKRQKGKRSAAQSASLSSARTNVAATTAKKSKAEDGSARPVAAPTVNTAAATATAVKCEDDVLPVVAQFKTAVSSGCAGTGGDAFYEGIFAYLAKAKTYDQLQSKQQVVLGLRNSIAADLADLDFRLQQVEELYRLAEPNQRASRAFCRSISGFQEHPKDWKPSDHEAVWCLYTDNTPKSRAVVVKGMIKFEKDDFSGNLNPIFYADDGDSRKTINVGMNHRDVSPIPPLLVSS